MNSKNNKIKKKKILSKKERHLNITLIKAQNYQMSPQWVIKEVEDSSPDQAHQKPSLVDQAYQEHYT